jgi:hypothetical protein
MADGVVGLWMLTASVMLETEAGEKRNKHSSGMGL